YYLNINEEEKGDTQLAPYSDTLDILKNKFSASYLDVPLEFRIRIKPDQKGKNFWIAPGFRAGILVSDFWKLKYTESNGDISKSKVYGIANIEKFHYGISLRAGYYKFGIYSFLALNNLFEKDKGPELTPFSLGITFTPF
ncbi:MAG: PorT family protein, partial [Chitinophagales bacterium]|nr:PorT family protein [Chitinophagales bacterium]